MLPFRSESVDAALSIAVIHHIATAERRVRALRELSRVLRVGGRVIISVWAMEQRHRKVTQVGKYGGLTFESSNRISDKIGKRIHMSGLTYVSEVVLKGCVIPRARYTQPFNMTSET